MIIKKIAAGQPINDVADLLDASSREKIECVNWAAEYPFCPAVEFAMVHDGDNIYLKYWVAEPTTMALVGADFGEVWNDSCVEFFISLSKGYYNFEFNALGHGLSSFRTSKECATPTPESLMSTIERYPSLEGEPFSEREVGAWSLLLKIPRQALFSDCVETLCGVDARINLYKCGDGMLTPHFVSWSPIALEQPNFHCPEFFREVTFATI